MLSWIMDERGATVSQVCGELDKTIVVIVVRFTQGDVTISKLGAGGLQKYMD